MSEQRLERHLRGLEKKTGAVLDDLEGWRAGDLVLSSSGSDWAALDVVEHLMMTDGAVLRVMRKNLQEGGRKVGIADGLRSFLVLGIMLAPTRVRIPAQVRFLEPTGVRKELGEIREEWAAQQRELREFVRGLSPAEGKAGIFKHPVGGWTTAAGALVFLRAHMHHHGYQIERIQKALARRSESRGRE